MERTVCIQLQPNTEQAQALHKTLAQFTVVYNHVCAYGWQQGEKNGVKLHHATYYDTKALCPDLVSDLLIQARVKATETLKSAFTWKAKKEATYSKKVAKAQKQSKPVPVFKPVRCPRSLACAVRYNVHTYSLNWEAQTVRLSTTQGKMSLSFTVPHFSKRYRGCKIATADLLSRNGVWWLHVVVDAPEPVVEYHDEVIGVDLGLNRPAVTSQRHFLGSRHWKEVDRRRFRLRRKLQSKGSKSAKRHLKKISHKQMRFHRDCDHVLSKRIVQNATAGSTIVLENLTNLREGVHHRKGEGQRKLHSWSFAQLYGFIAYKAQERGIAVERVDPRHTSQTCSQCGHQARNNRRSQAVFHCRSCGYQLNADLNASYNIRDKFCLAQGGTSVLGGPLSDGLSSQASV
ncbi:RNA-guided endonuclease InsQ/TnpB family protein [Ktedonobacter racemifer]|uniref:Transposase, IS605 OrfB family n=1 Tax=Ktedonobacter racemifer DSM 44963 TaxID=485913 RepID=D6TVZ7_KTERA|nr:RNA-guided endonuclease TnpB family protein [Ktedonobacter racemifer]EFH84380.1 transposase, IS605 OrfB family [Ktedonobacter racemifer DSM 44963]